ncbi:MAG TPA: GNAT family protein [Bauldia sp.]|nr:GNAT family protein [Bauldia sp.]
MASNDLPLGPAIDTTPAPRPGPVTLTGRTVLIEKLDPAKHADGLWQVLKDDDSVWIYLAYGPFRERAAFDAWLAERAASADPYFYAILDAQTRKPLGQFTLMEIRPAMRVIEVGNVLYSPALQRTPAATEAQYLLARYAIDTLGYRRYEWKCNALNAPSRRAADRFGFTCEGTFRQHMIIKGANRDTAWYSIIDKEWPALRAAFETWLDPKNFDADGKQRVSLADLTRKRATA